MAENGIGQTHHPLDDEVSSGSSFHSMFHSRKSLTATLEVAFHPQSLFLCELSTLEVLGLSESP